jgi:addiction module RelE/StbE family toxin
VLINWSQSSRQDILEVLAYFTSIEEDATGKNIVSTIIGSTDRLLSYPLSGKPGRSAETREIVVKKIPYVIIYKINADRIEILRVLHTSRLFPESMEV